MSRGRTRLRHSLVVTLDSWPDGLFTAPDLPAHGLELRAVSRAVQRGELVRVKRGAYVSSASWARLAEDEKHLVRARAVASSHRGAVFSHWSAAAILGLPIIGPWPSDVHVAAPRASGGRSEPGIRRHCVGPTPAEHSEVSGLEVTTVARTLADLASVQPFRFAVAPTDFALGAGLVDRDALVRCLNAAGALRGRDRAARVFAFADGRSGSPGESMSRAVIHLLGFPPPLLQVEHRADGRCEFTDFEWPEFGLIGEFDGVGKYTRDEYLHGRTPAEVVILEKQREDRLRRATGSTFARWGWDAALRVSPLRDLLLSQGLPRRGRASAADIRAGISSSHADAADRRAR